MFTFEPGVAIWTLVSFGIFFFVVAKFVYPRISGALEERKSKIDESLTSAEKTRDELAGMKRELEEKLKAIKLEELRVLSEAKERARTLAEENEKKLFEEFRKLRVSKEEHLKNMEANFLKASEERIAKLIADACERIIRTEITSEQQRKIIERGIRDLESIKSL